jgi:hypothetical protein
MHVSDSKLAGTNMDVSSYFPRLHFWRVKIFRIWGKKSPASVVHFAADSLRRSVTGGTFGNPFVWGFSSKIKWRFPGQTQNSRLESRGTKYKRKWCSDITFYWVANPLNQVTSSFEKDITNKIMSLKRRSMYCLLCVWKPFLENIKII